MPLDQLIVVSWCRWQTSSCVIAKFYAKLIVPSSLWCYFVPNNYLGSFCTELSLGPSPETSLTDRARPEKKLSKREEWFPGHASSRKSSRMCFCFILCELPSCHLSSLGGGQVVGKAAVRVETERASAFSKQKASFELISSWISSDPNALAYRCVGGGGRSSRVV